jgi:hypothetical protein
MGKAEVGELQGARRGAAASQPRPRGEQHMTQMLYDKIREAVRQLTRPRPAS